MQKLTKEKFCKDNDHLFIVSKWEYIYYHHYNDNREAEVERNPVEKIARKVICQKCLFEIILE